MQNEVGGKGAFKGLYFNLTSVNDGISSGREKKKKNKKEKYFVGLGGILNSSLCLNHVF